MAPTSVSHAALPGRVLTRQLIARNTSKNLTQSARNSGKNNVTTSVSTAGKRT